MTRLCSTLGTHGAALALLCGCGALSQSPQAKPHWTCGKTSLHGVGKRGHEYLVQFGVQAANAALAAEGVGLTFPEDPGFTNGEETTNPLVRGNYLTDNPDRRTGGDMDLRAFYGVPASEDWQYSPRLQELHFLRQYQNGTAASLRETTENALRLIERAAQKSLSLWNSDKTLALQFLGHATHTLQDGFSPIHVRRSAADGFRALSDICTFGTAFAGICHHGILGEEGIQGDIIWDYSRCLGSEQFTCLEREAQLAVQATAGFLATVGRRLSEAEKGGSPIAHSALLYRELFRWYADPAYGQGSGFFDSERL